MAGYCDPSCGKGTRFDDPCPCGPGDDTACEAARDTGARWYIDANGTRHQLRQTRNRPPTTAAKTTAAKTTVVAAQHLRKGDVALLCADWRTLTAMSAPWKRPSGLAEVDVCAAELGWLDPIPADHLVRVRTPRPDRNGAS